MTHDYEFERRKQRALERLGSNDPRCVICGESNWQCLESHHLAGQAYAGETVPVCRNCHRKLSDGQCDHPAKTGESPSQSEVIGRFLLGLADLFELLVEKLAEWGRYLIELAAANEPSHGEGSS